MFVKIETPELTGSSYLAKILNWPSLQATVFESVFYSLHTVEDGLKYDGLRRWNFQ